MSNTRNTPIESLETSVPDARSTSTRCGADRAAAGMHRGGDGVVRRYRALERCTVTLLTERRAHGAARGGRGR